MSTARYTLKGEYESTQEYAAKKGVSFKIKYAEAAAIMLKPCVFCGGKTPGYEGNSLMRREWGVGFANENCYSACWPCKRVLDQGDLNSKLDHLQAICAHLQTHQLEL